MNETVSHVSLTDNKSLKAHILTRFDNLINSLEEERGFFEHGDNSGGNWDRDEMLMAWARIQVMDNIMNEFNETYDIVRAS